MTLIDWFIFGLALSAPITVWVYIWFGGEYHEKETSPSDKAQARQAQKGPHQSRDQRQH
jgi:hypothetical protein